MRALIIDDAARAEVARVKAHAASHHYGPGQPAPGGDPRFVARLSTYRAVFTYTHFGGVVYRDLSVSVLSNSSYPLPNPAAVFVIADMFGFSGYDISNPTRPGKDWKMSYSEMDHCIRCAEPICVEPIEVDANITLN